MIYLDYSATTPVNKEVLESFSKTSLNYIGNPNSLHNLGIKSNELIDASVKQVAKLLNVSLNEVIFTSGASESNNTAIKGICYKYKNRGKHIITTHFEHSSIYGPLSFLQKEGFEVDFVDSDEFGIVSIDNLKKIIREDTILISIASVNSEIGIRQPIEEIGKFLKENNSKVFFHVDMTQSIGKDNISLEYVDLASFSAHKFYGIKGIGCLIKKEKVQLEPLIHGGKSTTSYRSGTPALALIVSLAKALRMALEKLDDNYEHVKVMNEFLKERLSNYDNVFINSNDKCIPHILNISVVGCKPETLQHSLEEYGIYISTQTACSSGSSISKAVYALTNDEDRASSSVRISLSYLTTREECEAFLDGFDKCYKRLTNLR